MPTADLPTIIAVIPAWNATLRLPMVLKALDGQVDGIVVVDNGSKDGTADLVATLRNERTLMGSEPGTSRSSVAPITLISNPDNRGYAEAINQGIERALADGATGVLLVNDDAIFGPGSVDALASAMVRSPDVGATTAHLTYADRPDVLNGAGGSWWPRRCRVGLRGSGEPDDGRYADATEVDYPSGAAALLRTETVRKIGGMDERYYLYYEDSDWGLRASKAGWRTVYVPEAKVSHIGWAGTRSDPARRRYYNVRNRLLFAREHAPWSGRLWVWGATNWLLMKQLARWTFPSRRRDAEAIFGSVLDHARGRYGRGRIG